MNLRVITGGYVASRDHGQAEALCLFQAAPASSLAHVPVIARMVEYAASLSRISSLAMASVIAEAASDRLVALCGWGQ